MALALRPCAKKVVTICLQLLCAMTVTASSDYIAQFMPDRTNAVQLHAICTEVALVHLGGVVTV